MSEPLPDPETLLDIARENITSVRFCFAITTDEDGAPNARLVEPLPLGEDWTVRFWSRRDARKVRDLERSSRVALAYQIDSDSAYVTLVGHASLAEDAALRRQLWSDDTERWFPGGPGNLAIALVELRTERIELWNHARNVMVRDGLGAAVLRRTGRGWDVSAS